MSSDLERGIMNPGAISNASSDDSILSIGWACFYFLIVCTLWYILFMATVRLSLLTSQAAHANCYIDYTDVPVIYCWVQLKCSKGCVFSDLSPVTHTVFLLTYRISSHITCKTLSLNLSLVWENSSGGITVNIGILPLNICLDDIRYKL